MPLEALYIIGIVALAAAFAYGYLQTKKRNRQNDALREEAVRQSYDDPEGYAKGGEERLRAQAKPE
jgi:hypothetical protein